MTTKQKAAALILRLALTVGLLWGAWYECGPFTWTLVALVIVGEEFRQLRAWLDRTNRMLDEILADLRDTMKVLKKNEGEAHDRD